MTNVEAACVFVALEDPQADAVGALSLDDLEQCAPDPTPLHIRMDVQVPEEIARKGGEADDTDVELGNPDLVTGDQLVADPPPGLLVRVETRQEGEASKGWNEDVGDCVALVATGRPDEHAA